MATTLKIVNELLEETIVNVSQDSRNWQSFLKCASMNYKYSFTDQLLIYAQRPNAVACADYDTWNNKLNRYVKGAGIGLLTEKNGYPRIRYVWDIGDTHSKYGRNAKQLKLWKVHEAYEEQVIESLENKYGELEKKNTLVEALKSVANNLTNDNYTDYFNDLIDNKYNTRLEHIENDVIETKYKELMKNSIAFMIMNRCGVKPDSYFDYNDFIEIPIFQDIDTIVRLGTAISEISEMGLYEIYTTLKNIQINEIEKNRTFDKIKNIVYDDSEKEKSAERSDNNEHDLSKNWGLSTTKSDSKREERETTREIFNNEITISKREQEQSLSNNVDKRYIDRTLGGDRNSISRENINDNEQVDNRIEYHRGIEIYQSNGMDRTNEQHQEISRGSSNERTNLQLTEQENTDNSIPFSFEEYKYRVGDKVYIGLDEFEITKIDVFDITLHDINFPLLSRVMNIVDFETKMKENPANDGLKVINKKNNLEFETITKIKDLNEKDSFTVARVISDNNCVELHYNKGLSYLEIGTKLDNNTWEDIIEKAEWFNKDLSDEKVLDKLEESFINHFAQEIIEEIKPENYYGEYNDEIDLIDHILSLHDINDIIIDFDEDGNIIANDEDNNVWEGKEFYDFLFNELFNYDENGNVNLVGKEDIDRLKQYCEKYENNTEEIEIKLPTEKEKNIDNKIRYEQPAQLSLFATREQELADRILEIFKSFDTKWKDNLEISSIKLEKWDHISSKKRNLSIIIKSNKYNEFDDNCFTQFNSDKTDEIKLREGIENNKFIQYLNKDDDFSIIITPTLLHIYYNKFDDKEIDMSIGKNEVLSSINNNDNEEIIDDAEITLIPKVQRKPRQNVINYVLHPEVPYENRINYKIKNDDLGVGGVQERYKNNIEAIKVLKKCEEEDRYASPEEQKIMAKYVGWGGLSQAFKKGEVWQKELSELLEPEEYDAAEETTLTAFYTPPIVIRAMYKALNNMGLKKGNILEPSCGIGHFIGMLPNNDDLKIYGVEKDSISGRIARQLYQKSSIAIKRYEDVNYSDSFFDVAIGNVPFGDFPVVDKKYDKHHFFVHDYFFAKTIDKVRPGGIIAFITSKGTMDKENSSVRKYIAQRADLLGAIRLPNNTFKKNAGTTVTTDIIFLQKRDSITDIMPSWVNLGTTENGIPINNYYLEHPDKVLGEYKMISGPHGMQPACTPFQDKSLEDLLDNAISDIHAEIKEYELDDSEDEVDLSIEADLNVNNFSYTLVDGKVYYRENSRMYPQELALTTENRVKGLIEIRDCTRELINLQLEDYSDEEIEKQQSKLNNLYDTFTKKYGLINSRANAIAFNGDNSYYLLCSLEILDENGNLSRKADMFSKRTIKAHKRVKSIDSANEALIVSIGEKAKVDLDYMSEISNKSKEELIKDLEGIIFRIPNEDKYVTADEYLSGNIREKIKEAEYANRLEPIYDINIKYLNEAKPKDLNASEINVRLGATWIPKEDYEAFMYEIFETDYYAKRKIKINYSDIRNEWHIENKSYENYNELVKSTYGTKRINGYKLYEDSLNLKDAKIYDYFEDEEGKKKKVLNGRETAIAQAKQEQLKQEFQNWIWKDPDRRSRLEKRYNEIFNAIKPREYDGSNIIFDGMNPEFKLRKHQIDAVARILYGGNTLLAHEVGAGKTFEMVAAAMESKRLGLCNKSLFVVPNHIIEQFAGEFLQLYPSANILVSTKKDFETANRKKFCSRIATGEYDAVIIGHSQFEKIPMSIERQINLLEKEIKEITDGIEDGKRYGATFTVKQLMKTKKQVEAKLEKLNNQNRKDKNVVTFEQLGVDRLFIDEAHYYKNLYLYTKMNNVSGIAQTEAQKSSDLYMKCKYLDEITNNKGIIFATGTPISNSMVELYTMQRYLQASELNKLGLQSFDAWASTFGETVTAIELAPEGTGYRSKTRFAKFYNLPELISLFKEVADVQTADMLNLPVPEAEFETVVIPPSEIQIKMVDELSKRAEEIRKGNVDPHDDNMLKITNDGKKLALDQRLMNELLPDDENSKVNICANNIFKLYKEYDEYKAAQLVFCDSSTPKTDGSFNIYDDLKKKLIEKGIPSEEIAFIHDADNEIKKKELFAKVRKGQVRVLVGSTQKMGAGTNCQDRLIALHDLDCPWRPSDLIQRLGRIVRQGNMFKKVYIFRYVVEKTFDAYLYQLIENKQKFISQIMTSKTPLRSASDVDEAVLSYAEIKALAAGNPLILEKTELESKVSKLKLLKQNHLSQIYELEDKVMKTYPQEIKTLENRINDIQNDIETLNNNNTFVIDGFCGMQVKGINYTERKDAGNAILEIIKNNSNVEKEIEIGSYRGFKVLLGFNFLEKNFYAVLKNKQSYTVALGTDPSGNIVRIDNELNRLSDYLENNKAKLETTKQQFEIAKEETKRPFAQEQELKEATKRLKEVDIALNMDEKVSEIMDSFEDNNESQIYKEEYER